MIPEKLDLLDIPPVLWSADDCDRAALELRANREAMKLAVDFMSITPEFIEQSWYDEEGVPGTEIHVSGHGWEQRFRQVINAKGSDE